MSDAPHKFELHIGDYVRDTEELSLTQHGIYLRLMLWYYSTAKPIPNDFERICRRIGATSKEEKASAEFVLTEFFQVKNLKWNHKRIDQELFKWDDATKVARRNANKRWEEHRKNKEETDAMAMRPQCDGNASLLPVASSLLPLKSNPLSGSCPKPKNSASKSPKIFSAF